jgi:hypothetical protein
MSQTQNTPAAPSAVKPCGPVADPVAQLNDAVRVAIGRFSFERPVEIVGRCQSDSAPNPTGTGGDPDIHDGTVVTAHGYARLALHRPTGTLCLFASKASWNVEGARQPDGAVLATDEGINKSYIIAAYRTDGSDAQIRRAAPHARRALRRFNEDLGERSEKHFTLYGASTTDKHGRPVEFHTNGRLAYCIQQISGGKEWRVTFYCPTKRKDGSFVPVEVAGNSLSSRFARVSRTVAEATTYEQARHQMAVHWQRISSRLWDEKSIYEGEGIMFNTRKNLSRLFNHVAERGLQLTLVTGLIGLGMGLISAKYGIIGGLIAAVTHTVAHHILDESYGASREALRRLREARQRLNIDAYPFGENVADHFKIQTPDNITRLCAKTDMNRFKGAEFEWLGATRGGIMLDHEKPVDGFRPSSLRAHLLFVHQRGFSSSCTLPDPNTRLDIFQSGLIRLIHERADGTVAIYSRYTPEACLENNLRLPPEKIDKMGDQIVRVEYDRRRTSFYHAFPRGPETVSLDDMMRDVTENMLFRGNTGVDPAVRAAAIESVRAAFTPVDVGASVRRGLYMGGNPPPVPPLCAAAP